MRTINIHQKNKCPLCQEEGIAEEIRTYDDGSGETQNNGRNNLELEQGQQGHSDEGGEGVRGFGQLLARPIRRLFRRKFRPIVMGMNPTDLVSSR